MRSKTGAALVLLAIFALGGVAGAASYYIYQNHVKALPPQRQRTPNRRDIVDEMARSLKLDAQQKEKLQDIFQQSRERYGTLSAQFRPQYDRIRAETNEAIRAILSSDQRKLFGDTVEKMEGRHQDRAHLPPPAANK